MKLSQKLIDSAIDPYFSAWSQLNERISASHRLRDGRSEPAMLEGIRLFRGLLAHCEGAVSPLNWSERLDWIEQQPAKFAAFRQLDGLFMEMKKAIPSKRIQSMRSGN
jgi:hypothetical protein